jgi:lysine 2,3-aminomutase
VEVPEMRTERTEVPESGKGFVVETHFKPAPRRWFEDVPDEKWNDWKWQIKNRVTTIEALEKFLPLTDIERQWAERKAFQKFRIAIPPYYLSLIDPEDPNCPIRLQAVPRAYELDTLPWEMEDSLGEERDRPVRGITHRYPDRVLFYVSPTCAMYCRHCTRKRKVSRLDTAAGPDDIKAGVEYIREHKEVRDVVVSGGDPLVFDDDKVEWILGMLRAIPHVEILRLGTRVPCTLPQRITEDLCKRLKKYQPLYINTHFNHPKECTLEAYRACTMLSDAGFPMGNQMVLLKGVNDDVATVKRLNHLLLMMRVKPYYIYMCDMEKGLGHFRTSIAKGLEIMDGLRGWTSGLAVPYLVVDAPGGGGKIPLLPEYVVKREGNMVTLRNFRGQTFIYHDAEEGTEKEGG